MSDLVLGWTLNSAMAPSYWMAQDAKPGAQPSRSLITASAKDMAYHTVIVAQSGSGKSFFLGRVLEELVIKTRGRLVVLDPNADYRRIRDVVSESWWTDARYDQETSRGRLPHEASRSIFEPVWKAMDLQVFAGPYGTPKNAGSLLVSWNAFPIAFLGEDLDTISRSQLYHCHEFVKSIGILETKKASPNKAQPTPKASVRKSTLDLARRLLRRCRNEGARQTIEEEFPSSWLARLFVFGSLTQARDRAISAAEFVSPEIERFYFGRAKEYVAAGIIADGLTDESSGVHKHKASVIDLPSFLGTRTQQVVLSSVVETVWNAAREDWAVAFEGDAEKDERVPVFIVLEEAHNIVPQKAQSFSAIALREQFRTIAAEGRKYGVFLILCTQRPDKIDETIVSECENRAVMKIGTKVVLEKTRELLGLESIPDNKLQKCLEFSTGRFLLAGPWAGEDGVQLGYAAMRRTVEGGRNLREDHWAVVEPARAMEGTSQDSDSDSDEGGPATSSGKPH